MKYEKLFEKGKIGRLELRNRVVMTAMGVMLGDWNGCATPEYARFYEERAKGGCGLIIPEFTSVDPDSGHCNRIQLGIYDARQIRSMEDICDAVHRHGAKIFVQLHHGGREAPPALNGGRQAMAPSVELNSVIGRDTILPREMTVEDIDRLVGLFVQAAVNSELAGADGVEIHGAHGYLLQQFMSPYTNKRTDEYGGSMENRCRFMVRILKGIREAVGPNFVVGARINGNDFVEGGNDQDACVEIAKYLEPYVDYFNVSCGVYASAATMIEPCYSPEGWRRPFVEAIKHAVKVPVIGVNALRHTEEAEKLLEEGVCDFVGMSRMHIADPYLVAKAKAGREDLIRKCLKCMNCNKSVVAGRNLHCAINPVAGRETRFGDDKLIVNGAGRPVAIIGGGPAGMEAARIAASRGHHVTLFEKTGELGGAILGCCMAPGKEKMKWYADWIRGQIRRLEVDVRLHTAPTVDDLRGFDIVLNATGASSYVPDCIGAERVVPFEEAIACPKVTCPYHPKDRQMRRTGQRVLVWGDHYAAADTAAALAGMGKEVTIVTENKEFAASVEVIHMYVLRKRFAQTDAEALHSEPFKFPVRIIENSTVYSVEKGRVVLMDKSFQRTELAIDDVITCHTRSNTAFFEEVRRAGIPVVNAGDSKQPRNLHAAVMEGATFGLKLEERILMNANHSLIDSLPIDVQAQLLD